MDGYSATGVRDQLPQESATRWATTTILILDLAYGFPISATIPRQPCKPSQRLHTPSPTPPYPRATLNLVTLTASPPAAAARLRNVGSKSESSSPDCPDGSESDTSGSAIPGISSAGLNTMSATTGLACWVSTIMRNRSYRNVNGISSTLSSSSAGTSAPLRTSDHFRRRQVVGQRG